MNILNVVIKHDYMLWILEDPKTVKHGHVNKFRYLTHPKL